METTDVKSLETVVPAVLGEAAHPESSEPAPTTDAVMADKAAATTSAKGSEEHDKAETLRQIEFYLGDSNLPYDKFMWALHTKTAHHWIPISVLSSFKRMEPYKHYGVPWIAKVLKEESEELLEVDEKGENVRRKTALVPPGMQQYENSVYAKGFPDQRPGLQQEIEAFFTTYGQVASVRMRRAEDRKFKNSVFCEFKSNSSALAFLAADPKPKFEDKELLTMSKDAYVTTKSAEKGFPKPNPMRVLAGNMRKGFNAFTLMEEEAKRAASKGKGKTTGGAKSGEDDEEDAGDDDVTVSMEGKTYKVREDGTVDEKEVEYPKARVMVYAGASSEGNVNFKDIKDALSGSFEKTPYIAKDFENDPTKGFAQFSKEVNEQDVATVQEKVPKIGESDVTWSIASEEEEHRYWINRINTQAERNLKESQGCGQISGGRGGRGGQRGRGGRGGGRGGRGGRGGGKDRGRGGSRGGQSDRGNKRKREGDGENSGAPKSAGGVPTVAKKAKVDDA
ncbi:hypothetical protein FRB97_008488 [Tulasnella sp. 331]|nr:hypothetical protein FRB97_008488 [Tulasnella sp. 331]KAG8876446.1 hypothetical protein FRB98_007276 [Tulasnella sp. 332]